MQNPHYWSTSTEYTVSLEWLDTVRHGLGMVTDSPYALFYAVVHNVPWHPAC